MADTVFDLRQLRSDTAAPVAPPAPEKPLVGPTTIINVRYTDPEGQVHEDPIVSKVLTTVDGKAQLGRILAKLAGTQRFDDMPSDWRTWATAVATCTLQIDKPPDWLLKWLPVDNRLLFSIYNKLWEHDALFFRAVLSEGEADASAFLTVDAPELDQAATAAGQ